MATSECPKVYRGGSAPPKRGVRGSSAPPEEFVRSLFRSNGSAMWFFGIHGAFDVLERIGSINQNTRIIVDQMIGLLSQIIRPHLLPIFTLLDWIQCWSVDPRASQQTDYLVQHGVNPREFCDFLCLFQPTLRAGSEMLLCMERYEETLLNIGRDIFSEQNPPIKTPTSLNQTDNWYALYLGTTHQQQDNFLIALGLEKNKDEMIKELTSLCRMVTIFEKRMREFEQRGLCLSCSPYDS